jgi:hypothetical protein
VKKETLIIHSENDGDTKDLSLSEFRDLDAKSERIDFCSVRVRESNVSVNEKNGTDSIRHEVNLTPKRQYFDLDHSLLDSR